LVFIDFLMLDPKSLLSHFDLDRATIAGRPRVERRLSDLRGCFASPTAFEAALAQGNPLIYAVASIEPAGGEGDLHYGLGMIMPGRVGEEYWMTKGHLHAWRPAAEFYIGLRGEGVMLLEDEATGASQMVPLTPHGVVYVPGSTAHRTMNTGREPLLYLGVYPARAGHDYQAIAEKNFRCCVVARDGQPTMVERSSLSR
jgi:glucose-6-phosphate isomerase